MRVVSEIDQASLYNLLLTNLQPTNLCQECVICAAKPTAAPSKEAIVCRAQSPDYSPTYNGPEQNLVVAPKPALLVFAPKPSLPEWPRESRNKKVVIRKQTQKICPGVTSGQIFLLYFVYHSSFYKSAALGGRGPPEADGIHPLIF